MSGEAYRESLQAATNPNWPFTSMASSCEMRRRRTPPLPARHQRHRAHLRLRPEAGIAPLMTAVQHTSGKRVNRLTHINISAGDLLNKLEAVRLVCQETGCAQRYLTHDALNAIGQVTARIDDRAAARAHGHASWNTCTACRTRTSRWRGHDGCEGRSSLRPTSKPIRTATSISSERNARGIVIRAPRPS